MFNIKTQSVMKRLLIIAGLALAMLCSIGCSKFEYIFSGNDPSVIEPVTSEDGAYSINDSYLYFEYILEYNGIKTGYTAEPTANNEIAVVINDKSQLGPLEDIALPPVDDFNEGKYTKIPDIDFDKYSLVIGTYINEGSYSCTDTRVKKKDDGMEIYVKLEKGSDSSFAICSLSPFAAIYPKLPTGYIKVNSWMVDVK